jgi:hypothetical protein
MLGDKTMTSISPDLATADRTDTTLEQQAVRKAAWRFIPILAFAYLLAMISFGFTMGSYGIGIWLPQMLKAHGMSITQTGWLSAVPYFFATVALLWWAKRVESRGGHIANLATGLFIGAVALGVSTYFHALLADYNLTKRTDVYMQVAYQRASHTPDFAAPLGQAVLVGTDAPSSSLNQTAVLVSFRHLF